jgi:hypothetical protein
VAVLLGKPRHSCYCHARRVATVRTAAYYRGVLIRKAGTPRQNKSVMHRIIVLAALWLLSSATRAGKTPSVLDTRAATSATSITDCCSPPLQRREFFPGPAKFVPSASGELVAQAAAPKEKKSRHATGSTQPPVSLSPRFSPGQAFRYAMEFETTTTSSRSGIATDPQGPSKLVIAWDATILLEVLPAETSAPGNIRLRTTYEKSTAHVTSDTFDPAAAATEDQYQKLEGKVVEFTLDANGKVILVAGLEDIVDGEKAVQAAREWIAQLDAGSGAPAGGVSVGQKWSSEKSAASLPVAGMVWRTESEYLRNEICHPPNLEAAPVPSGAQSATNPEAAETCAVILTRLNLVRPKSIHNPTPEDYRKNGMQTAGKWDGSAESLSYISLRTGLAVSITQTGTEEMDVTLTTGKNTSMRYAGTVLSRSQVALIAGDLSEK